MIGLGTWSFDVDTMFFKGEAQIRIFDNGGEYGFEVKIPGEDIPEITIKDVVEDGNTLNAVGNISLLKGKDVPVSLTLGRHCKRIFKGSLCRKNQTQGR
jgi:hypothetical protein